MGTLVLVVLLVSADSAVANVCRWSGAGADNFWSTAANWTGCGGGIPRTGDVVGFSDGAGRAVNQNDIPGLTLNGIFADGTANEGGIPQHWDISGLGVTVTSYVSVYSPPDSTGIGPMLRVPMALGGAVNITNDVFPPGRSSPLTIDRIDLNGFDLMIHTLATIKMAGVIFDTGRILKDGPSPLELAAANVYTGPTIVLEGLLRVFNPRGLGAAGFGNDTFVRARGRLAIGGSTNAILDEALTIEGESVASNPPTSTPGLQILDGTAATLTGPVRLLANVTLFVAATAQLSITGPIAADTDKVVVKSGPGPLIVSNPANTWTHLGVQGTVRVGAAGAIPVASSVGLWSWFPVAVFDLNGHDVTVQHLGSDPAAGEVRLGSNTLTVNVPELGGYQGTISGSGGLVKTGDGRHVLFGPAPNSYTGLTRIDGGILSLSKDAGVRTIAGPIVVNKGTLSVERTEQIADTSAVVVNAAGVFNVSAGQTETIGSLAGNGHLTLTDSRLFVGANNASTTFSGEITKGWLTKVGTGTLALTGSLAPALMTVDAGMLLINGTLAPSSTVVVNGGTLSGTGRFDHIGGNAGGGLVSPGPGAGQLRARTADLTGLTFAVELNGPTAGAAYDQLALTGNAILSRSTGAASTLHLARTFEPLAGTAFTIIDLAPGATVTGTFAGLAEGASFAIDGQRFRISYRGGDGNDVVVTALDHPSPVTYLLAEGATGGFFDDDVLIANPNDTEAPVTVTFFKENGEQIVTTRTIAPRSRTTIHVDAVQGLEGAAASAQVTADDGSSLVVERSMFWDQTYYAGHTGSAIDQPAPDWFFAEGSQGFFSTFVLVVNPNAAPAEVTFTFLLENEPPVVKTVPLGAFSRLTLDAGAVPEIVGRSFGVTVHATQPVMAERSMYFGTTPGRLWSGGHESAGITAPSTHWFLAEGATGAFFDTFILLSNPQNTPANVTLQYLLDSGETITVPKTIAAHARLTTNIETEADPRLHNAAVSTVINADVPIIAERSMYWPGVAKPWGEGHNSFGVVEAGTRWGLAEGRVGGPFNFQTYILLANAQATAADVTVTFLRESGAPIVKTYRVPPTSRFNVDSSSVTELQHESFGAEILVTNNVPIVVERSLYWDAAGVSFSGGTNATGIRLPPRATP